MTRRSHDQIRRRVTVHGIVQGVGFRPAMYRRAVALEIAGLVGNDAHGVFIEIEGSAEAVTAFIEGIAGAAPPLAVIDDIATTEREPTGEMGFRITESVGSAESSTLVAPDIAPCDDCLAELADPTDRRHHYPFVNCTNCGPRYSIIADLPYDRPKTTMAGFAMCAACAAEYEDPADRRYHAQPTCCPTCGPRLALFDGHGSPIATDDPASDDVVAAVTERLTAGEIVAIKGLGGYHLAVDARDQSAVARLRARKHREEKPFAVLVGDLAGARDLASVSELEADLLASPERPIVLLGRRDDPDATTVAASVAPGNRALGVMLSPTPLHVLVAEGFGGPLVMTSGNRSHEPIVADDATAIERLGGIADVFCAHDRPIQTRVDDSVTRVVGDRQIVMRRARGLAPRPVRVPGGFARHTLACGALLKSTVCVGRDERAVVSQHLGDLDDAEVFTSFAGTIDHLCRLFDVTPEVVAHDLHPDMASTSYATDLGAERGIDTVAIQHHHAHIASCLADNATTGPVIGVAFDGLGLGADGSIWGGEVLRADLTGYERLGHLASVPMPGGDAATREPWRMAAAHLTRVLATDEIQTLEVFARNRERWAAVLSMARTGVGSPPTSSAGRLFDAVAALVGVRDTVTYEGQAAIELEQLVDLDEAGSYPTEVSGGEPFVIDTAPMIAAVAEDLRRGVPGPVLAARFHNAVVDAIVAACERARARTGLSSVALSGGVFQNALLVERASAGLAEAGFAVLTHRRFPPNDGGISLGQAAVVAARDRSRS